MFWYFGIVAPRPEMEPTPPALEHEVLTTGSLGKSFNKAFKNYILKIDYMTEIDLI